MGIHIKILASIALRTYTSSCVILKNKSCHALVTAVLRRAALASRFTELAKRFIADHSVCILKTAINILTLI